MLTGPKQPGMTVCCMQAQANAQQVDVVALVWCILSSCGILPETPAIAGKRSPEGNDIDAALLQRNDEVLGRQGTGLVQVEDHNVCVDLLGEEQTLAYKKSISIHPA